MPDIPESYTVGEEFFLDPSQIDVEIDCLCICTVNYSPFEFDSKDYKVKCFLNNGMFNIKICREISEKLFNTLNQRNNYAFIIAYINKVLPKVNEKILEQKYLNAHLLGTSYSMVNMNVIILKRVKDGMTKIMKWPFLIPPFPKAQEYAVNTIHIFIRDFIESATCFFSKNYDESIRKSITAIDNYFHNINFKGKFKSKIKLLLRKENYLPNWEPYLGILEHNVYFIYEIRNEIVHDRLRLSASNSMVCDKAFGTLWYLFRNFLNDDNTNYLIYYTRFQFLMIQSVVEGKDLDVLKRRYEEHEHIKEEDVIHDFQRFEESIFNSLRINEDEKQAILSKVN
ncbi:MAG: hypothetical protein ABI267_01465 [Ginsengibacter sp.]